MFSNFNIFIHRFKAILPRITFLAASLIGLLFVMRGTALAQFNSGSTGADGAFNPTQHTTLQVPESGVFNFTTINIPVNVYVSFTPNSKNTPVTMLATGNVTISGRIYVGSGVGGGSANGRFGGNAGPGGFKGGNGGSFYEGFQGSAGDGPGGGAGGPAVANGADVNGGGGGGFGRPGGSGADGGPNLAAGGPKYGTYTLLPLIGGSGGGGGSAGSNGQGGGGGGGGGALLLASSGNIIFTFNGDPDFGIFAGGGDAGVYNGSGACGGGGSGGAIRLVANNISITSAGQYGVYLATSGGGRTCFRGNNGGDGYIRLEAFAFSGLTGFRYLGNISTGNPNPVTIPNSPQLKIVSVGGVNAPVSPKGSFYQQPDIVVPTAVSNPVTVNLEANNLPVGTVLQVTLTDEAGNRTSVNSTPLAGTQSTSTATASVTLPTSGIGVISATVTLNVLLALGAPMHINGKRIDKVEIGTSFGGESLVTYITDKGERLKWPGK